MIGRPPYWSPTTPAARFALGAALVVLASTSGARPIGAQTITSAANQLFHVNDAATAISPITVADPAGGNIKFNRDIYITIPATSSMTWDTSVLTATIGGSAAGRVTPSVTYLNGNQTVKITVNTSFVAGDQVIISGLRFTSFSATAAPGIPPAQESQRSAAFAPRRASLNVVRNTAPFPSSTSLPHESQTSTVSRATILLPLYKSLARFPLSLGLCRHRDDTQNDRRNSSGMQTHPHH